MIAYSLNSTSDRLSPPTKPDLLFPQIKQRSSHTHKPDRLPPNSNSDRPSQPAKPDRLNPKIKQRSQLRVSLSFVMPTNSDDVYIFVIKAIN
ncbi:MAG: hypothetical protein ACK5XR_20680 [Pseudanabaena sp.]